MRVGGEEANIKIGLADLIIAAAPALKVLADYDLSFVPQCLIYLIEGLRATALNDVLSQPHKAITEAIHSIFCSTDPKYRTSILKAIEAFNSKYSTILLKYCPEWDSTPFVHKSPSIP